MQDHAETLQSEHGNALIVTQIVNGSGIDTVFVYQSIGGDPAHFHCAPQSLITNQ